MRLQCHIQNLSLGERKNTKVYTESVMSIMLGGGGLGLKDTGTCMHCQSHAQRSIHNITGTYIHDIITY